MYAAERVTFVSAVLTLGAALALGWTWQPLRTRPLAAAVLVLNLSFALLYFWSLGEAHHIQVSVSPTGVTATVDGDTTTLPRRLTAGAYGFQEAPYEAYRIQATGEAGQNDTTSLLGKVAAAIRLAQPTTAWTNVRVTNASGRPLDLAPTVTESPAGSWSKNRRGEWQGPPGSYILYSPPSASSYTISADLMRPDGGQILLMGVDRTGTGYGIQPRFDQPDALWVSWRQGTVVSTIGGTGVYHLDLVADVQRAVRTILSSYLFALLFAALAVGAYPVLSVLFTAVGSPEEDDYSSLERLVRSRRFRWGFFALVTILGTAAAGLVSTYLLDRIPHVQDSVAYLFQAEIFAGGRFHAPAPPAAIQNFFTEEYMPMYLGKWFSQYPPGHPLMLAIGVLLGAPWLVEPVLAALSVGFVYLLGRRVYGEGIGILAALLGLSSPFWLFLGSSFMSHATGLFFIAGFMLCFARLEEGGDMRWALLAGFLAGMAFITRQLTAVGALAPFAVYALLFGRRSWQTYLPLLAGAAVPATFLMLYNWVQMGGPLDSTYAAWSPHYALGFGDDKAPVGAFPPGHGAWNAYQNLSMLSAQLYGWPYGVALAFAFLPFILGAARSWDYLLLASFLGVVVLYAFYWCGCLMYGPRFYYETLVPLFLLTARGMFELARVPLRLWPRFHVVRDPALAAFLPALLVVALVLYNLRFYLPAQIPLYQNYNYSSGAELRTVQRAGVHHAIVFVVSNPPGFWASYGNVFFANDPLLHGDIIYARDEVPNKALLYTYFPGRAHYRLNGTVLTRIT